MVDWATYKRQRYVVGSYNTLSRYSVSTLLNQLLTYDWQLAGLSLTTIGQVQTDNFTIQLYPCFQVNTLALVNCPVAYSGIWRLYLCWSNLVQYVLVWG